MSAIAGLIRLDGAPVSADSLSPALDAMAHYGRDAGGIWNNGPVAVGCRLQHLTPESTAETGPLTRDHLTSVADVRLDGRPELCSALGLTPAESSQTTDNELVLRAFERWGESCAEHLIGDYAFAIWDAKVRRLVCARDHIGVRPFYYWHTASGFAFATDLRGLFAIKGVPAELDELEVARLLLGNSPGYFDNVHTFYRDVRKLPFGHTLTLDDRGLRLARHWFPERLPELRLGTNGDYVDRLFSLVERAVSDRLRARVPVGAHLSGGLDSSSVAVLAARLLRQRGAAPPAVFSWSPPPGAKPEETEHRRIVAICRQEGLTPIYTDVSDDDERRLEGLDITLRPAQTLGLEQVVQRKAAAHGIGLMLSGWGGDEGVSFNSRGLAAEYLVKGDWKALAGYLGLSKLWQRPRGIVQVMRLFFGDAILPALPDILYKRLAYRQAQKMRGQTFILPEFAARCRHDMRSDGPGIREVPGSRRCQIMLYEHGHITARMESWTDFGAEHGISYSYPLTDRRVLEFIYSIPPELHRQDGRNRHLYRLTTGRLFPSEIPWDTVKQDPALQARMQSRKLTESQIQMRESLCQPNPWVDETRLRSALKEARLTMSAQNALACLVLWEQRKKLSRQAAESRIY